MCLLTHVLCKPTNSFFQSFIATMSNSLQASFTRFMKNGLDKYHVWGTLTSSPSRSSARQLKHAFFLHSKGTHVHVFLPNICRIHVVSYLVWKSSLCFIIFHTKMKCICRWKLITNKKTGQMRYAYNKDSTILIIVET